MNKPESIVFSKRCGTGIAKKKIKRKPLKTLKTKAVKHTFTHINAQ